MADPTQQHGFPVVTAQNAYQVLADLGVQPWEPTKPPLPLEDYSQLELSEQQRHELKRFSPKADTLFLRNPKTGQDFTGFRTVGGDWAATFTLLPGDLLALVGEYKHGMGRVSLTLPAGRLEPSELNDPSKSAKRELEEETGLVLDNVVSLSQSGLYPMGRRATVRYYPYLGIIREPVVPRSQRLDETEDLRVVLMPLNEWLKLIDAGQVHDEYAVTTTFLALRKLGRTE
jgi:ADP-ribose pyrophosphatase